MVSYISIATPGGGGGTLPATKDEVPQNPFVSNRYRKCIPSFGIFFHFRAFFDIVYYLVNI